jgi:sugar phosphate isomerase/epimerase
VTATQANQQGLDFVTATDLDPCEFIRAAAENGCRCVSLLVHPHPGYAFPDYGLLSDIRRRRQARDAAAASGVAIEVIEAFVLGPDTDVSAFREAFEYGAYMGATFVNALVRDPRERRRLERLAQYAELAVSLGLRPMIEPVAPSSLSSFAIAIDAIRRSAPDALVLEVDALHFFRTGSAPGDLLAIDARYIGRAQICDGPRISALESRYEALQQRRIPGTGEFPLRQFLEALPAQNLTIGVEVPLRDLADAGVGAFERIRRCVTGAKLLMDAPRATY